MSASSESTQWRARLVAACFLLAGIALIQSPGLLVADTKLDLAIAPANFLDRAAHLWDADGAFGQLQNQAYGYLWPMGPFFLLGSLVDLPGWIVQRLWLALVMSVALVGSAKLARELGVRSHLACLVAGFAYALSPRMLTVLGPISIEAWPSAVAPWVLLPLVIGSTRGSPWRAAGLSALAIGMVGGVNAAATSAVLPLGAIWLLTRRPGSRQWRMLVAWPAFTALATLWWLVPLFVMGAYSPPFLDFIESAATTTFPTTLYDALRGTSNWVPYVSPELRGGNDVVREYYLAVNTAVVMIAGVAGLAIRRNPHRLFLVLSLVTGLALVTMGHTGSAEGWVAASVQNLLDGVLAPARNVHKFDPVIRLPMILGLAFVVQHLIRALSARRVSEERFTLRVITATVVAAVAVSAAPAMLGRITPEGGFESIPDYWGDAADWLAQEQGDGVALLVPGSSFGTYVWGDPRDEPLQSLAEAPWAVRNAVPLAPAGNIRMLDAIEERIAQGRGSAGLASYLRRAGVSHVVVRNDIDRGQDIPDPVLVHEALAESPGIKLVADFGPPVGGEANLISDDGERIVVNGGWQDEFPAIEIYEVDPAPELAVTSPVPPVVVGGPEDLLGLTDLGILDVGPVLLASDLAGATRDTKALPSGSSLVLTDGFQAAERNFGRIHDSRSAVRTASDPRRLPGSVPDYLPPDSEDWLTWADYGGSASVSASGSQADADASGAVQPGQLPYAATDGSLDTEFVSDASGAAWWQLDLAEELSLTTVSVTGSGPDRQRVLVRTEAGASEPIELRAGITRTVRVPGATSWVRVEDASRRSSGRLRLAEVGVPGEVITRSLVLPTYPVSWGAPQAIVLRALMDARTGCAPVALDIRCVPGRDMASEESRGFGRVVNLPEAQDYDLTAWGRALPGNEAESLILDGQGVGARSSSTAVPDLRGSALAAIDGDPGTTWTAALIDDTPSLDVFWLGARGVDELRIQTSDDAAARPPERVRIEYPGGSQIANVGDGGVVRFGEVRTSRLRLTVLEAEPVQSLGFDGVSTPVPIGISEVAVPGVPTFPLVVSGRPVGSRCGDGPTVTVGDNTVRTRVRATARQVFDGAEVTLEPCGAALVDLSSGSTAVRASASQAWTPTRVVMSRGGVASVAQPGAEAVITGPTQRSLLAPTDSDVITLRENVNPGWVATQGDDTLAAIAVDGWRGAWIPKTSGPINVSFEPDGEYRLGLGIGLGTWLALLLALTIPARRWRGKDQPPAQPLVLRWPLLVLTAVPIGGVLAGWPGALVGLLGALVGALLRNGETLTARAGDGRGAWAWVPALGLVPAAVAYALRPWGDDVGWAGELAWAHYSVVAVVCAILVSSGGAATRSLRCRKGRSTPV